MAATRKRAKPAPDHIAVLDDLSGLTYQRYLNCEEENVKLGELLKMLELRHKIAPQNDEQREFWSSMEKIRKQILSSRGKNGGEKPVATTKRKKK